jgi:hypothetical protein
MMKNRPVRCTVQVHLQTFQNQPFQERIGKNKERRRKRASEIISLLLDKQTINCAIKFKKKKTYADK